MALLRSEGGRKKKPGTLRHAWLPQAECSHRGQLCTRSRGRHGCEGDPIPVLQEHRARWGGPILPLTRRPEMRCDVKSPPTRVRQTWAGPLPLPTHRPWLFSKPQHPPLQNGNNSMSQQKTH